VRRVVLGFVFFSMACVASTSVTRTGTGIFAPRAPDESKEEETPIGLTLSIGSVAQDGTVILELRNYSMEPFTFLGTPDRPRLVVETQSGNSYSKHTISPTLRRQTHEVPAGERIQLETNLLGVTGRVRIGVASHEFGYIVWTNWLAL
jgi:hypothetical protein